MNWTTSCPDWEQRIVAKQSLMPCAPLFPEQAELALRVFKELTLVDVAGSPKIGDVTREWVLEFVAAIFGAYDPDKGKRLISEFFLLISKKNTKSTMAAGIMFTALILNWRYSAEFLILAPTKEIADNSFIPIRDMIGADEELSELFNVSPHTRTITHRAKNAILKVVAAESDTVGGKKATGILVDELWLFGKKPNAESMLREATGGLASRPEGFVIYLTTQSDEPPAGVFKQKLNFARDVRDGIKECKTFLPLIYEFPDQMLEDRDYLKSENFYITNPNLGASVDEDFLLREFEQAQGNGEESLRGFLAKHLNVEIGLALRSDRWAGADYWQETAIKLTLDELIRRSEVITLGIDGGGLDDLLGLSALGRDKITKQWLFWFRAWMHERALDRNKSNKPKYLDLANSGDLRIVKRLGEDTEEVADIAEKIFKADLLDSIGIDQSGIGLIVEAIVARGVPQELIQGISQGWRLGGAIKTTERKLAEGGLLHADQPLMNWCVSNAKVEPRGNAILITKQASGTAKIDPLMAGFNAVSLMSLNPEAKTKKYQMFFV